jgi:hypothetical protein
MPDLTDEAKRVLKYLQGEGTRGRIEAERQFPHPHHFKLRRAGKAAVDITLSTIDRLVIGKYIRPILSGPKVDPRAYDQYHYTITDAGIEFCANDRATARRPRGVPGA